MVSSLLRLAAQQSSQLTRYIGYYYEFRYSSTTTDLVLKSLIQVFESDGLVLYKSIERLRSHALENAETPAATGTDVFKYVGLLIQLGNRIHMLDYEAIIGEELSHMVLFPPYRSRISTLLGMKMGVTATEAHEPIAGRVVLEKIGRRVNLHRALERCGLHAADSESVPASVLSYLQATEPGSSALLRAHPGPKN